jgi:hypothetical protein
MLIDADSDASDAVLQAVSTLAVGGLVPWGVPTLTQSPHVFERALLKSLGDAQATQGACSVAYNLAALERASQALRERLSSEQWGLIRTMDEAFVAALACTAAGTARWPQVLPALDRLVLQLAAVTGAQTDRMTRDHGWRLLTVGRLLERLLGVSTLFKAFLESGALHTRGRLRAAAGPVRQRHHLPRPLPAPRRPAGADRPAGAGQHQPACLCRRAAPAAHRADQAARRRGPHRAAAGRLPAEGTGLTLERCAAPTTAISGRRCWACRAGWATPRRRWPRRSARATSRWPTALDQMV